jgi:hypothetical protein
VELTRPERNAAIEAMRECSHAEYGYGFGTALDSIIEAVNKVRAGDHVGTIRCKPDGKAVAVRDHEGAWITTPLADDWGLVYTFDISSWPVIYSPPGVS